MSWGAFEAGAPDMSGFGRREIERDNVVLVGTITWAGTPRISCVEACLLDGELYLGMMWRSRKAADLLRDPRVVIRNGPCVITGGEGELTLRGRALTIQDPEVRRRFAAAVAERTVWKEPRFHLFSVDIETAALIRYQAAEGMQSVKLWPQGTEYTQPYG